MPNDKVKQIRITVNPRAFYFSELRNMTVEQRRAFTDRLYSLYFSKRLRRGSAQVEDSLEHEDTSISDRPPAEAKQRNKAGKSVPVEVAVTAPQEKSTSLKQEDAKAPASGSSQKFKLPKGALAIASQPW